MQQVLTKHYPHLELFDILLTEPNPNGKCSPKLSKFSSATVLSREE